MWEGLPSWSRKAIVSTSWTLLGARAGAVRRSLVPRTYMCRCIRGMHVLYDPERLQTHLISCTMFE